MTSTKSQIIATVLVMFACCVAAQRGTKSQVTKNSEEGAVYRKPSSKHNNKTQIRSFDVASAMYSPPISGSRALSAVAKKFSLNAGRLSLAPDPIEFTPRHFQFPGCVFKTNLLLEFRAAPKAFCWPILQGGPIEAMVPIATKADFAVVTVNGSFPTKGNTFGLNVGNQVSDKADHYDSFTIIVKKDSGEASSFNTYGDDVGDHFSASQVVQLSGARSINIEVQATSPRVYVFVSSIQVHYVNSI